MKTRHGFVSNSSSSSFIIKYDDITAKQLNQIRNYSPAPYDNDGWSINFYDDSVTGFTVMDNGSIGNFFKEIGVTNINWDYDD
jgi:hypothetical protein